eukprot:1877308-Alexandrium_andersonii.AAC.1
MQNCYSKRADLEFQLQIGSKLFLGCPMMSLAEHFCSLNKTFGIRGSYATDVVSMDRAHYMDDQFIIGVDCGQLVGASFTGQNAMS